MDMEKIDRGIIHVDSVISNVNGIELLSEKDIEKVKIVLDEHLKQIGEEIVSSLPGNKIIQSVAHHARQCRDRGFLPKSLNVNIEFN